MDKSTDSISLVDRPRILAHRKLTLLLREAEFECLEGRNSRDSTWRFKRFCGPGPNASGRCPLSTQKPTLCRRASF